ncbi:E3 ubiquitin-protein ligase DZIP3-like isoform X2 [Montipora capricornis]|uniref:E3 ubiquitin-protein ligase DZIP3-like isoform X2 n=1 Tax=Montipora capricornis TaxID=246305 RepID=UPI0035F18B76
MNRSCECNPSRSLLVRIKLSTLKKAKLNRRVHAKQAWIMASGPAVFLTTRENTNYARLCRLLVDVGSQALRDTFDRIHPPATLHRILSSAHPTLQSLRKKRILNPTQWGKLYPTISSSVSSASFDITLLMVLLRNVCSLSPPVGTGSWDKLPLPGDNSPEANIVRIKYYRNQVYAHASQASVDDATFNMLWQDISHALLSLGSGTTYTSAISRLKTECMDPDFEEHYRELLRQWKKDDDNTKEKLDELKDMVKKWKSDEGSTKEKLENVEEMLKQWKSDEETTKDKVGQVEDMLKKWKSDEGSTTETLENMKEMLKSQVGEVKDMLTQWKSKEEDTKDNLGEIEDAFGPKDDAEDFIRRYFVTKEHLAKKLIDKLRADASLEGLTASPLNTRLLCLLCEDFQGDFPKARPLLFLEIVRCVLRRYRRKKNYQKRTKTQYNCTTRN